MVLEVIDGPFKFNLDEFQTYIPYLFSSVLVSTNRALQLCSPCSPEFTSLLLTLSIQGRWTLQMSPQ